MTSPLHPDFYGGFFLDIEKFYANVQKGKLKQLPKCQDLLTQFPDMVAKKPEAYTHKFFISHRWDNPVHPDIRNWQLDALLQFSSELIFNRQVPACFWYDYSSLPQRPRTADEDLLFQQGLQSLDYLCRTCINVPLISNTDPDPNNSVKNMLKRGWILVELFVSQHHEKVYLALFEGKPELVSFAKANRINWRDIIPDLLAELPFFDVALIRKWFDVNTIQCTNGADLDFVAQLLHEHIYNYILAEAKGKPKALAFGKTIKMTPEEIAGYWINKYGSTPFFPDTYFEVEKIAGELSYLITPKQKPALPPVDQWTTLTIPAFNQLEIDVNTHTSKFFPGIVFEYKIVANTEYHIKPAIKKLDW